MSDWNNCNNHSHGLVSHIKFQICVLFMEMITFKSLSLEYGKLAELSRSHPLCSPTCCYGLWAAAVQRPSRQHRERRWSLNHLVIKDPSGTHIRSPAPVSPYDRNLAEHAFSISHRALEAGCGVCDCVPRYAYLAFSIHSQQSSQSHLYKT